MFNLMFEYSHTIEGMSDQDKAWLKTQFKEIDKNGHGVITLDDISEYIESSNPTMDELEALAIASQLTSMMDPTNKGEITLKDFVRSKVLSQLHRHLGSNQEKGLKILETIGDPNKTGQIDSNMLENELSRSMTVNEKNKFMKQIELLQNNSNNSNQQYLKPQLNASHSNSNNNNNNNKSLTIDDVEHDRARSSLVDLKLIGVLGAISASDDSDSDEQD